MSFDLDGALGRNAASSVFEAAERCLSDAERLREVLWGDAPLDAVTAQNFVIGRHVDTYGIGSGRGVSIHTVSDAGNGLVYHSVMADSPKPWLDWGNRFRTQIKERNLTLAQVGERMSPQRVESTLRSWTNDTRKVNLLDFFEMCSAAEVDPAIVLFGRPIMTELQRDALGALTASLLESDPTASPSYDLFGEKVRKSVRAHKAAEAKAASRLEPETASGSARDTRTKKLL